MHWLCIVMQKSSFIVFMWLIFPRLLGNQSMYEHTEHTEHFVQFMKYGKLDVVEFSRTLFICHAPRSLFFCDHCELMDFSNCHIREYEMQMIIKSKKIPFKAFIPTNFRLRLSSHLYYGLLLNKRMHHHFEIVYAMCGCAGMDDWFCSHIQILFVWIPVYTKNENIEEIKGGKKSQ